jgi:hypothetical protein
VTKCTEVIGHLSEFLDEELQAAECEQIARHLAECSDCEDTKRRLIESIEACHRFRLTEQPRELPAEVRDALKAAYAKVLSAMQRRL